MNKNKKENLVNEHLSKNSITETNDSSLNSNSLNPVKQRYYNND